MNYVTIIETIFLWNVRTQRLVTCNIFPVQLKYPLWVISIDYLVCFVKFCCVGKCVQETSLLLKVEMIVCHPNDTDSDDMPYRKVLKTLCEGQVLA